MEFTVYPGHLRRTERENLRTGAGELSLHRRVLDRPVNDSEEDLEENLGEEHENPLDRALMRRRLQNMPITPYLQRTPDQKYDVSIPIYSLYLAMHEPQKRLHTHKGTTQRIMSVCDAYARLSLDLIPSDEIRIWYTDVLKSLELWASWDSLTALLKRNEVLSKLVQQINNIPQEVLDAADVNPRNPTWITLPKPEQEDLGDIFECLKLVLTAREEIDRILRLEDADARSIINLLDNVVNLTDHRSRINDIAQQTLRRLCGRSGQLPSSFILSQSLIKESDRPVACGGFADVYRGRFQGQAVALKVLRIYSRDSIQRVNKKFCREAVFWRRLSHPNIVPFLGISSPDLFNLCMVSAWMDHGNLLEYIKKHPETNRLKLSVDVANGLSYIHRLGLVHGDLKSANVLINNKHIACLSDFGLTNITHDARTASLITTSTALHGSIRWMAPELLHPEHAGRDNGKPSAESDIYAFAMVMLEIFTGKIPFYRFERDATVVLNITLGVRPERPGPKATDLGLTDDVWEFIERCWQSDWRARPNGLQILAELDKFLRDFTFTAFESQADEDVRAGDNDSDSSGSAEIGPSFLYDFANMLQSLGSAKEAPDYSLISGSQSEYFTSKSATPEREFEGPPNNPPPNSSWNIFDI